MKGVGMKENQEGLEDILYWFGDTYLAISGSTDDVDLIEKEHEELLCQAEQKLLSAGFVKLDSVELDEEKIKLLLEKLIEEKGLLCQMLEKDIAHAIAQSVKEIVRVKQ